MPHRDPTSKEPRVLPAPSPRIETTANVVEIEKLKPEVVAQPEAAGPVMTLCRAVARRVDTSLLLGLSALALALTARNYMFFDISQRNEERPAYVARVEPAHVAIAVDQRPQAGAGPFPASGAEGVTDVTASASSSIAGTESTAASVSVRQPLASAELLQAVAVEVDGPAASALAPASEAVQEEAQEEKKEEKKTPPMPQHVAEAIFPALPELHSIQDLHAAIAANTAAKVPTVVATVSAEAVAKLGPKMAPLLVRAATQGAAVYKVVVEAKDLAKRAERTCEHARLVHSLKTQGRLLLPALLVVSGGRNAGRCLAAGGMHEWEQVIMDAMHTPGVTVCGSPLMS